MHRKLAAEAIGTFFLLATVIGSGIMADTLSGGNDGLALLGNAVATGAVLAVLITGYGPISGAHFNPAVTGVFWWRGDINTGPALAYVGVQVVAGCAGVITANLMFGLDPVFLATTDRSAGNLLFSEVIATIGLVATILTCVKYRAEFVAAGVGLYITAAYFFTSSTSFANPAVTIARTLSDTFAGIAPTSVPGFIVAQMIGAGLAAVLFGWLLAEE